MVLIFTAASLWADAATELSAKLSAGNWDTYARLPGECPEDTVKELIAKLAAGNWNTYALSGESPEDTVKDLLSPGFPDWSLRAGEKKRWQQC